MNAFPTCLKWLKHSLVYTLLLTLISSRYFVHNARRDTERDTVIQMTLKHVFVWRIKKKKDEKIAFNEDIQMLQSEQIHLEE